MKRFFLVLAVAIGMSVTLASAASAGTVYGSTCSAEGTQSSEYTLVEHLRDGPIPMSGVITSWRLNVVGAPAGLTQRLKVLRGGESEPVVLAESSAEQIPATAATFKTRLPVSAGDLIGISSQGKGGTSYFCGGQGGDLVNFDRGDPPVGKAPESGSGVPETALPVTVTIEPDADGDGYGDETQDGCPTNAAIHGPCPVTSPAPIPTPAPAIVLGAVAVARKGALDVYVTASGATRATVAGHVRLAKGKSTELRSPAASVASGALTKCVLPFPASLRKRLKELTPKRSLTVILAVTAPGASLASPLTVKVSGQGAAAKPTAGG